VIRIDDFPTGTRPLLPDPGVLLDVLWEFERRELPYVLGLVPALLPRIDRLYIEELKALKYMTPAMHGYDHRYDEMSARLLRAGDPYNVRTITERFDEFEHTAEADILARLMKGRELLQHIFGHPVACYIPPCNFGGEEHGRAVAAAGFLQYRSAARLSGCPLPMSAPSSGGTAEEGPVPRRPPACDLGVGLD